MNHNVGTHPTSPVLNPAEVRSAAVDVLRRCATAAGFEASARAYGHHQIWARDSMITLLGASLLPAEPVFSSAIDATLSTLAQHRSSSGCIPNNVDVATGAANYRAYADAGLWFVMGSSLVQPNYPLIQSVLQWYECQDVDNSGLISIQEASDWQDLFCTRGKGLYVNCLYVMALKKAAAVAESSGDPHQAAQYRRRADAVRSAIHHSLWYAGDGQLMRQITPSFSTLNSTHDSLGRPRWIPEKRTLRDRHFYLPYVGFRQAGEWFDTLGNLFAILSGVADAGQASGILNVLHLHATGRHLCRAIYPPVQPGDSDWRDYYGSLNLPNHYHNGGVWPFIGGFFVAALVKLECFPEAEAALAGLAHLNQTSEFAEWCHGETLEPLGVREQAWSAAMYIFAERCVATRTVPLL